ncbi:MAG: PorV/PorQ family protein [Bacteroidetes bacterium]|nr:PorV/PorQ family protein [Bacteroidota bacterium]
MKIITQYIVFFIFLAVIAAAQNVKTGFPFLKTGASAQALGMGETVSAFSLESGAQFYNPALLASFKNSELSLSHKAMFAETSTEYLAAVIAGSTFSYGVALNSTSVRNIEIRTQPGPAEGTFSARDFSLGISAATKFLDDIQIGVTAKFLYEKIFVDEASGYGIDFGGMYFVAKTFALTASVNNLGSMNAMRNVNPTLPASIHAGASSFLPITEQFSALGNVDIVKTLDDNLSHFHFGTEISYEQNIKLRLGYLTGYAGKGFSTGVGFQYSVITFNYAYVPMTASFSPSHVFTIGFIL